MLRKQLLALTLLAATLFYLTPQVETQAFEPISMMILAPIAIQAAKIAAPYVIKALGNMAKFMVRAGWDLCGIVRLPLGLFEATVFAPWTFKTGLKNIGLGLLAPLKFCGWMLILPLSPFGVGVGSR